MSSSLIINGHTYVYNNYTSDYWLVLNTVTIFEHPHTQILLLSPQPPPPSVSPGETPSHSPVTTRVFHLLMSPGSSTALLSLPWILVSPPQSCAQNSCLSLWKRVREGQQALLVVAVVTLRSSYKVSAHMHTLTVFGEVNSPVVHESTR